MKAEIYQTNKIQSRKIYITAKMAVLEILDHPTLISRKIRLTDNFLIFLTSNRKREVHIQLILKGNTSSGFLAMLISFTLWLFIFYPNPKLDSLKRGLRRRGPQMFKRLPYCQKRHHRTFRGPL